MKKYIRFLATVATVILLAGCGPEQFIWWSPDGQIAAVRTDEGLRLATLSGQLSGVVLPGQIQSSAWLTDGSGLVVSRLLKMKDWATVEKLIPPGEAAATKELARAIPDLLKAALKASGGSWDKVEEKFLKPLGISDSPALEPAWSCALSLYREQIVAAIEGLTNAAVTRTDILSSETNGITVYEISMLSIANGHPKGEPRALIRSLRPLLDPVLSPHYAVLAFRTGEGALKSLTLDGRNSTIVADQDVLSAAWATDGRTLMHLVMAKSDKAGEIRSRTVVNDRGELLQVPPQAETLAMAVFGAGASPRLSVLADGRLLFASLPITLPARPESIYPGAQFFLLNPAEPGVAPLAVGIREGSLPDDLSTFAPSPDGRFVAVVEAGTDVVAVLELATGKVKVISPPHNGWKSRLIPAWRNNRELAFAALPSATAGRPELILWQEGAPDKRLSKEWPDSVVKPWLEAK